MDVAYTTANHNFTSLVVLHLLLLTTQHELHPPVSWQFTYCSDAMVTTVSIQTH